MANVSLSKYPAECVVSTTNFLFPHGLGANLMQALEAFLGPAASLSLSMLLCILSLKAPVFMRTQSPELPHAGHQ